MTIEYYVAADDMVGHYRSGMPDEIQQMIQEAISVIEKILPGLQDALDASNLLMVYDPRN